MTLRSEGWSVQPSFSPHGPTSPVTLLLDDAGFTQLAGQPAVAWQTPWSEVAQLRLVRRRRGTTIVMLVAGTLYQWRRDGALGPEESTELAALLGAHGGREAPRLRRAGALVVALVVTLASFGGYFASLASPARATSSAQLRALEAVNLNAGDVSSTWGASDSVNSSALQLILTPPGEVLTLTTDTTAPPADSPYALAAFHFQRCLGVSNVDDRVFGQAGQEPLYQVASPIFSSSSFGGVQVESVAQYYPNLADVAADQSEMSRGDFSRCFVEAEADELVGASGSLTPDLRGATVLSLHPFVKGWVRAASEAVSLPLAGLAHVDLVIVVEVSGHYEVTLAALVGSRSSARATLANLVNAQMLRVTSTPASAA